MDLKEEIEMKKEFQLERIILFSDAVFAIIITIMVIELRLPEAVREASLEEFKHEFHKLFFQLAGYGISFFFVAMFWMRHVKLLGFLKDYTKSFLILNLLFLFCISLFPFAVTMITGFKEADSLQARWGFNVYVFVILISMLAYTILAGYMMRNKEQLCFNGEKMDRQIAWKALRFNYWLIPVFIAVIFVLNQFEIKFYYLGFVMAIFGLITARLKRHFYSPSSEDDKPAMRRLFSRR